MPCLVHGNQGGPGNRPALRHRQRRVVGDDRDRIADLRGLDRLGQRPVVGVANLCDRQERGIAVRDVRAVRKGAGGPIVVRLGDGRADRLRLDVDLHQVVLAAVVVHDRLVEPVARDRPVRRGVRRTDHAAVQILEQVVLDDERAGVDLV